MYSFYNTKSANEQENFENLLSAIKGHDQVMILSLLRDNPELATRKDRSGKTIPMLAAEAGCTPAVFQTILEKSISVLHEVSKGGETVQSILKLHNRKQLMEIFNNTQLDSKLTITCV